MDYIISELNKMAILITRHDSALAQETDSVLFKQKNSKLGLVDPLINGVIEQRKAERKAYADLAQELFGADINGIRDLSITIKGALDKLDELRLDHAKLRATYDILEKSDAFKEDENDRAEFVDSLRGMETDIDNLKAYILSKLPQKSTLIEA